MERKNTKTVKARAEKVEAAGFLEKELHTAKPQPYVIVRGDRSGVFAGYLVGRFGQEITLRDCRRLWYWEGAASISQLAVDGTKKPNGCNFTVPVETITILDAIEIIPCTAAAKASIEAVKVWKM